MSWCYARVWAAAGQRSLGRAGINSLGMLESLRSPDRKGIQPGPGGQVDPKGQVRKNWGMKARRDWGSVRAN